MKLTDFIQELDEAGWQGTADAQHTKIIDLHRKLFPVIAELEDEVADLAEEVLNAGTGG